QGFTLVRVGTLVDQDLHGAVAFVDGARPFANPDRAQAIETGCTEVPLLDINTRHAHAVALRGPGVELTRTAIGAIAVDELASPDLPFDVSHEVRSLRQVWSLSIVAHNLNQYLLNGPRILPFVWNAYSGSINGARHSAPIEAR